MGRLDSQLHGRVIFLVGARRSGTNWLQRILTSHPLVLGMPTETYLFSNGIAPLTERFQHANPGSVIVSRTFMHRERFLDATRAFVDQVFLDHLERINPAARYVLERTPAHVSHLELIADVYPDARVIHIVRDGRDVARSLLSMEWGPRTMTEAALDWSQAVQDGREGGRRFGERYREVLYEALLADPRAGIEDLFAWLELELDAETRGQMGIEAASAFNVDPGSPAIRADKWRSELSAIGLMRFERIAGEQLKEFGYPLASSRVSRLTRPRILIERLATNRRRFTLAHWRPRAVVRDRLVRAYGRQSARATEARYRVVELFERMVADGQLDEALAILASKVRVSAVDGAGSFTGRGPGAARELLSALDEDRVRGMTLLSGDLHIAGEAFVSVITYALGDGSRWSRTIVFDVEYPRITRIAMHRFQLAVTSELVVAA